MAYYLESKRLYLREVRVEDVTDGQYYNWLNDEQVNRYLETRFLPQSRTSILDYVRIHAYKTDEPFFAICLRESERHIGNIKLGPINWYHRRGDISYFIGERDCWGKGYAAEAISCVVKFGFEKLDLARIEAGTYSNNVASQRVLEKNGFKCEGERREAVRNADGERTSIYVWGLIESDYYKTKEK